MKTQLVAVDLDGTLVDRTLNVPASASYALSELAATGMLICIATGRSYSLVPKQVRSYPDIRYYITCNGARIIDNATGNVLYRRSMTQKTAHAVIRAAALYHPSSCLLSENLLCPDENYASDFLKLCKLPNAEAYINSLPICKQLPEDCKIDKINLLFSPEQLPKALNCLRELPDIQVTASSEFVLEITAAGISKGSGIRQLSRHTGIELESCAAIGDSENDLEIFSCVGTSIAMGNGCPEIKNAATYIARDISDDGFADAAAYLLKL